MEDFIKKDELKEVLKGFTSEFEKRMAEQLKAVSGPYVSPHGEDERGLKMAAIILAMAKGLNEGLKGERLSAYAKDNIENFYKVKTKADKRFMKDVKKYFDFVGKSSVEITDAINNGNDLIIQDYMSEVIDLFYPQTIIGQANVKVIQMPNGNMNIPKLAKGVAGGYIGEKGNIVVDFMKFVNIRLAAKKLAVIVPTSYEFLEYNAYNAVTIIRDTMVESLSVIMDKAILYGSGTNGQPLGVANTKDINKRTIGNVTTPTLDDVPTSITTSSQYATLGQNNVPDDGSWLYVFDFVSWFYLWNERDGAGNFINRDEMKNQRHNMKPFLVTTQVNTVYDDAAGGLAAGEIGVTTDIFLCKWTELIVGDAMTMRLTSSDTAIIEDSQGNQINAFQADAIFQRLIMEHDFLVARPEGISVDTYVFKSDINEVPIPADVRKELGL